MGRRKTKKKKNARPSGRFRRTNERRRDPRKRDEGCPAGTKGENTTLPRKRKRE